MMKSFVDTGSTEYVPQATLVANLLQVTVGGGSIILILTLAGKSVNSVGAQEYNINVRTALSYEIES